MPDTPPATRRTASTRTTPATAATAATATAAGATAARPGAVGARALVRTVLRAPLTRRALAEAVYCLIGFPLGLVGAVVLLVLLALGAGFTLSLLGAVLGMLLVVAGTRMAGALGGLHRALAGWLLGERFTAPPPFRPGVGIFGRLDARLRDGASWRATVYILAKLPVCCFGMYAVVIWVVGLVNVATPVLWTAGGQHPDAGDPGGLPVLPPVPVGGFYVTTLAGTWVAVLLGIGTLLLAPWVTRLVVAADRWLIRALLGAGTLAERVRDLEETRALAVDDSVALLRRLERDLHDGAQVRLVAVAMSLDMIKERLGEAGDDDHGDGSRTEGRRGLDVARVRELVDGAHRNATEALTELRDLARGIHPPALDDGLPDALATLTARSSVPVELSVDIPDRPTPAIETIAYFCAAELLTNVIKHSGARRAVVHAAQQDGVLRLRVTDDGLGGATLGAGSGLTGLLQRIRTVDGGMEITSPAGGPTVVTVDLPLHA